MNKLTATVWASASAAALASTLVVSTFATEVVPTTTAATIESSEAVVSGTIRWVDRTHWVALNDAGHVPEGISRVEVRADRVRVYYTFTATKVGSMQVTPDEAFASANVRVGASVGYSYADIFFYMGTSTTPVSPSLLSKRGGNIWITGLFHLDPVA